MTRITGTLHEDVCTFMTIPRSLILRLTNVSEKCVEKIKAHIFCWITFIQKPWRLWENVEKYGRAKLNTDDNIIRHMRFACWTNKATDTHSEYTIFIAIPRQQWLHERASLLHLYVHCLSCLNVVLILFNTLMSANAIFILLGGNAGSMGNFLPMFQNEWWSWNVGN
jgi:hypothetical protein